MDANLDTAKDMFDVNVFALVSVTQAFAPLLIASRGTVVNIGSIAGKAPFPFQGLYNASKAAANLLSDQLRIELKPFGVSVILVVTGSVRTKFYDNIPTQTLPDNSVYLPAKKQVELIMSGKMAQQGFDVNEYAESVVRNSLKGSPTVYHWVGTSVSSVWIVSNFLWHTAWVCTALILINPNIQLRPKKGLYFAENIQVSRLDKSAPKLQAIELNSEEVRAGSALVICKNADNRSIYCVS